MSFAPGKTIGARELLRHELDVLHGNWGWYLVLGIALIALGTFVIGAPWMGTLASVTFLGVLLVVGGAFEILGAFWSRRWSGFFANLLMGILYLAVGIICLDRPVQAAADLTILIAAFLIVGGLFRVVSAISARHAHWGWIFFNGVIDLVLGVMIWRQWPGSALWVIGLFVGIEMLFAGWTWVMLAFALKGLPKGAAATAAP